MTLSAHILGQDAFAAQSSRARSRPNAGRIAGKRLPSRETVRARQQEALAALHRAMALEAQPAELGGYGLRRWTRAVADWLGLL